MGRILATLWVGTVAAVAAMLVVPGFALALPSETPDSTPMVNGPVRTLELVGTNVWVGGNFSQVQQRDGTVLDDVGDLAVFDADTGKYKKGVAPALSGNVRDIAVYGTDVVVAGTFPGPTSTQKNLVVLDGATGRVVSWYNAPALQSVLAAPTLGRVYGGGVSLSAFDFESGKKLWTRAKTTVDPDLRTHKTAPGYRDLELDGSTVWAACACDAIDGQPAKALAKLTTEGAYDPSWRADAGAAGIGISVAHYSGQLYLGAGGNDFLARYSKADGKREWFRDTSGSVQAVEFMDGQLVVGGHFWEVADQGGDRCGFRSSDPDTLDPYGECQTRKGLAAYSFGGTLEPSWDPVVSGKYNLVWALLPDGAALHFGGEFTKVSGIKQTFYARLS
jgi:hypothetical protein